MAAGPTGLAVATKVLPLDIFVHHLRITLTKSELIRWVVKEERQFGSVRDQDGLQLALNRELGTHRNLL